MNTTEYANNLFEQPWWLDTVAPGKWKESLVHDKNGEVIGRQVIVSEGKKAYMPEQTQTLGIWMAAGVQNDYGAQKRIIQELTGRMKEFRQVRICLAPENKYVLPFIWSGYQIVPRFTYRINQLDDLERLYEGFNKTAKKNIKAAGNKVGISYETDFDELWEMLNVTFEAQNRKNPMSKERIRNIVDVCEKRQCGKYISAKDSEGNVHSCAYFVYDKKVCYYLFGATDAKYRSSGAQSLVLWEGIRFAAKHSEVFDFEGSMIEGIENFFRQFNCENTVYYEIRKVSLLAGILYLAKPKIKKMMNYKI